MTHAPTRARLRSRSLVALLASGIVAAGLAASTPAGAAPVSMKPAVSPSGNYIVLLDAAPAVAQSTGRFDPDAASTQRYTERLVDRQDVVADSVGAETYYHYTASVNGFAAEMTEADAALLERRRDVVAVVPDERRELDTTNTPSFLGLSGTLGLWRRLGGASSDDGAGRGTVIGVVDSGLDSDSPSFADVDSPVPADWNGECDEGDGSFVCNNKVIGGHFFNAGQGGDAGIWEEEFLSPEDHGGHGTHVGSTAAGRSGTAASAEGIDLGIASGMAPAAKLAAYKVCWSDDSPTGSAGCFSSDSVAAIDQAVKDGVDVINFSISGSTTTVIDPVEIAFMYAADAGVFVAASAGNSGPNASTVAHASPWITTVAATTHAVNESTLATGDGESFVGASVTAGIGETPMVLAEDIEVAGTPEAESSLCLPDSLDPTLAAGNMVVCTRGVSAREEKSQVVEAAGGVAMVLVNAADTESLNGDLHVIPTVHLNATEGGVVKEYVATDDAPTGEILAGDSTGTTTPAPPSIAGFSSRGPSLANGGDMLKPDIAAPGVDVLAAVAPEGNSGRNFSFYSGTSMSSPHIAGLALLIKQKYPAWSPMAVKSAMMTTSTDLSDGRDPFHQGAGFVVPNRFMNPGLVFDSDFDDWQDFLTGQGLAVSNRSLAASNFNAPSIALNGMAGSETVTREVTNVDNRPSTYSLERVSGMIGVRTTMSPASFTLRPGQSQQVRITVTKGPKSDLNTYVKGYMALTGSRGHVVRFPVVVNPTGIDAPDEVNPAGSAFTIRTKSGVEGVVAARRQGLVPANDQVASAEDTEQATFDPADPRNYTQDIEVAAGGSLRVQLLGDFSVNDDLDLFLQGPSGDVIASSAAGGSDEEVTLTGLPAGTYTAHVQAWAVDGGGAKEFTLRSFAVNPMQRENWSVAPVRHEVEVGQRYAWQFETNELARPHMGVIVWRQVGGAEDGKPVLGRTLVTID